MPTPKRLKSDLPIRIVLVEPPAGVLYGVQRGKSSEYSVDLAATGEGGNLGGLARSDAHCQRLAKAAGSTGRQWRAYLSAAAEGAADAVHARDRIGKRPVVQRTRCPDRGEPR